MLKKLRQSILTALWETHKRESQQIMRIEKELHARHIAIPTLDHFAIIDLPSAQTGIPTLSKLFEALGFIKRGTDYLADKQNDFAWLTECDYQTVLARDILPQVVVADFRLDAMPMDIRHIIEKYVAQSKPFDFVTFQTMLQNANDPETHQQLVTLVCEYFAGRDWTLPTVKEFNKVQAFNELLAWVLVFGRKPNHFTYAIHLLKNHFANLSEFLNFITQDVNLLLNHEGGMIKGGKKACIEQASTNGMVQNIHLLDGTIELPHSFVEFVWRYPLNEMTEAHYFRDYFPDFIAQHANHVIESLYTD